MTTKTEGISIKATEEEKRAIDAAAEAAGLSRSALLIHAATTLGAGEAARRVEDRWKAVGLLVEARELTKRAVELLR